MTLDHKDRVLLEGIAKQVLQLHTVVLGVEGQGGLVRKVDEIADNMVKHQTSDTIMFQKMEKELSKSKIETLKMLATSACTGGLGGVVSHLIGK